VTTGIDSTCVLFNDQTAKCWGAGESGQLGDGKQDGSGSTTPDQLLVGCAVGGVLLLNFIFCRKAARRRRRSEHHADRHGLSTHVRSDAHEGRQVFRQQRRRSARAQRHVQSWRCAEQRAELVAVRFVWRTESRSALSVAVPHVCRARQQRPRRVLLGLKPRWTAGTRSKRRALAHAGPSAVASRPVRIRCVWRKNHVRH
jgi:hypothetical protein